MKTTKRVISTILVVVMCLTMAPLNGFMEIKWEGFDFPEFDFSEIFTPKAKAAISGYYTYSVTDGKATITDVNTSIRGNITIPSTLGGYPVTSIGEGAFMGCYALTSVTIPDSVTSIGERAFAGCYALTSVTIPDSVTSIDIGAFKNCYSLTSIIVDENNSNYSSDANGVLFNKNRTTLIQYPAGSNKTAYTIPDSVTSIAMGAFYNCSSLTSVSIPDSVTSIGDEAFAACDALESVTIGNSVTSIGDEAFAFCDVLTSVTIPASVTSIGSYAFRDCDALTSVTIPDSVTSIGSYAFADCNALTSVTIPDSVTSIGEGAFYGCYALTSVSIPDSVTSIGNYAFYACFALTSVTIPDSVTSIGYEAFYACKALTSVTIPDSVTFIGDGAFNYCYSLTSIIVDENNSNYSSDANGVLFNKNRTTLIQYTVGSNKTAYTIPDSVTSIAKGAFFNCSSLTSVSIPDSVTSIGDEAFAACDALESVTIGNSVTSIGDEAFYDCDALTSVTIPDSVTSIGGFAFAFCSAFTSVTIPDSVTSIGWSAFADCDKLTDVYYGGSESDWQKISIGSSNTALTNATIHYNSGYISSENIKEKLDNVLGLDYTFTYNDNYFSRCSYEYNHDLAIMSNCLAISAMVDELYYDIFKECFADNSKISDTFILENNQPKYISEILTAIRSYSSKYKKKDEDEMTAQEKAEKRNAWQNIIYAVQSHGCAANDILMSSLPAGEFFNKIGFANPVHYNYMSIPQMNSIACVIANKKIGNATVIAIGIRGVGYGAEWGGNFNVGTAEEHEGFRIAKEKVLNYLSDYIKNNNITGDVKFWISGYSRAAATSNLVAAALDEGANGYDYITALNYEPKDVYAYTFETPIPTRDKNTKNALYTNIFNIINRIDYVPKVAPETWGYSRYGVDCFLPSPETYGDKVYSALFKKMQAQHENITGKKYTENFTFYDAKVSVKTISFVTANGNISQSRYLDELITIIAKYILKNPSNFTNNYQSSFQKLMIALLGGGFENVEIPENTINEIKAALFEGIKSKIFNMNNSVWRSSLATILSSIDKFNLSYIDAYNLLGLIDETIVNGIAGYNYVYTLIENASDIKPAHFPEMNFAWVTALEGKTVIEKINNKSYRVVKYNCPIDIKLYDEDDNLLATICGDNIEILEDCYLSIYIDADGQKCFCLPEDVKYRFEITGTDNGEMNCSFNTYDFTTGQTTETINYYDISVSEGSQFFVEVDSKESDFDAPAKSLAEQVIIRNESDEEIEIDEILDTENATITVTVESDSLLSPAIGGGMYNKGEFANVEAYADTSEAFVGWYIDGQLVSTDASYRFMPENDCKIVAKWTSYCNIHGHTDSEWIVDKDSTCSAEGSKHIECTVCEEVIKTDAIEKLPHNYNAVVTPPTCEDKGYTTYTCACGASYAEDIPKLGHNFSKEFTVDKEATYTESGLKSKHCLREGCAEVSEVTVIPKLVAEFTDSDMAVLAGNAIGMVPGLTVEQLLSLATEGSVVKKENGDVAESSEVPATGMVLELPDGTEHTIVVLGDVDGDGGISAADARLALRASVGLEKYSEDLCYYKAANVEGNDKLSSSDARLILRASVGLEDPKAWLK